MPDLRPRTGICRSETTLKRQEKADGTVWADQAFGETYAKTACLQAFRRWRDPDSNRGHHDFQSCALPTELSRRDGWIRVARDRRYRGGGARAAASRCSPPRSRSSQGSSSPCCCCAAATTAAPKAARSEPLAYVPAGSADVVFDLDTREPLVALAVEQLAPRVTQRRAHRRPGPCARRRPRRRGARRRQGVAGLRHRRAGAASQRRRRGRGARRRRPRRARAPRDLARALDGAPATRGRYARATFDKRFAGLPADAGARVAFDPRRPARPALAAARRARPGRARCATAPPC